MLIYRCDNCHSEHKVAQIVGKEFSYGDAGFGSLAEPVGDKRDLCRKCMKAAERAWSNSDTRHIAVAVALHNLVT